MTALRRSAKGPTRPRTKVAASISVPLFPRPLVSGTAGARAGWSKAHQPCRSGLAAGDVVLVLVVVLIVLLVVVEVVTSPHSPARQTPLSMLAVEHCKPSSRMPTTSQLPAKQRPKLQGFNVSHATPSSLKPVQISMRVVVGAAVVVVVCV